MGIRDRVSRKVVPIKPPAITLEDMPELHCPECQGKTFTKLYQFRAVSPLISADGKAHIVEGSGPVKCVQCGKESTLDKLVIVQDKSFVTGEADESRRFG